MTEATPDAASRRMAAEIWQRLRNRLGEDHARGCQGRNYDCTCGFDYDGDKLVEDATAHIVTLTARIAKADRALQEHLGIYDALRRDVNGYVDRALAAEAENATLRGDKISLQVALEKSDELRVAAKAQLETARRALEEIAVRLNCRGEQNAAHYCPNCDNSLWDVREIARRALQPQQKEQSDGG